MAPEIVKLTLPSFPEYAQVARITAASVAAQVDADYDAIEDVRMAAEEVFILGLAASGDDAQIALDFEHKGESLEIRGSITGTVEVVDDAQGELSVTILKAISEVCDIDCKTGSIRIAVNLNSTGALGVE